MKSRLLEIATCYNIQVIFEKLNEILKPFRQYLNVKKYTEKLIKGTETKLNQKKKKSQRAEDKISFSAKPVHEYKTNGYYFFQLMLLMQTFCFCYTAWLCQRRLVKLHFQNFNFQN